MVDLPETPYRVAFAEQDHPLIREAERRRKPHEKCWCGSGRKYRKCHRDRESEEAYSLGRLLAEQEQVFWRNRGCMHPAASEDNCSGKVIDSHSIQRKGPLKRIIDSNNHVCHLVGRPSGKIEIEEIGWRKASVFPGYCEKHDSDLFRSLEETAFSGKHEQCVLQCFRNICNELYRKTALVESLEFQRTVLDRGCDFEEQLSRQLSICQNIEGQSKSRDELINLWEVFANAINNKIFSHLESKTYFFKGNLDVTSYGALHAEYDFSGKKLVDMWDLSIDAHMLSHAVLDTNDGGAISFVWISDHDAPSQVVESFDAIANDSKGDIFIQYCFLNTENNYFSRAWWDQLDTRLKQQLESYVPKLYYDGGAFVANDTKLVGWNCFK